MQTKAGRDGSRSKRRNELNRIALADELKLIEYSHDEYLKNLPDARDEDAFNIRQKRRSEILALLAIDAPFCPKHSIKLICPKCIGSRGGRKTTTKHKNRLSNWGKMGGRGKKNGFSLLARDSKVTDSTTRILPR
jgi:hypothetical protein